MIVFDDIRAAHGPFRLKLPKPDFTAPPLRFIHLSFLCLILSFNLIDDLFNFVFYSPYGSKVLLYRPYLRAREVFDCSSFPRVGKAGILYCSKSSSLPLSIRIIPLSQQDKIETTPRSRTITCKAADLCFVCLNLPDLQLSPSPPSPSSLHSQTLLRSQATSVIPRIFQPEA